MWCSSFPEVPGRAKSPSLWRMCRIWLLAWIWVWKLLSQLYIVWIVPVEDNNHYNQSLWEICVNFSLNQRHKHKNRWNFALVRFNRKSSLLLFIFFILTKLRGLQFFPPWLKKLASPGLLALWISPCVLDNGLCVLFLL
jgi:hypothetical protein